MSLTPTVKATDPPPANPPLCTIGWFQLTPKPKQIKINAKIHQMCPQKKSSR